MVKRIIKQFSLVLLAVVLCFTSIFGLDTTSMLFSFTASSSASSATSLNASS